jgi:phenylacetate-CoA ligase
VLVGLKGALEKGIDTKFITKALVTGGALFPSLREEYRSRGIQTYQCYAVADIGLIAYESPALEGMIVNENLLLEIVRPGTGDPLPDGEVGEVVVTIFREGYPLLRFATGDLSAILVGTSPCGRTNTRIKGWLGRADQTTKIKAMFVHPEQVEEIRKRHPSIGRLRLVVQRQGERDVMSLLGETEDRSETFKAAVEETLQKVSKMHGVFEAVAPGSLPNDGKVISDERKY